MFTLNFLPFTEYFLSLVKKVCLLYSLHSNFEEKQHCYENSIYSNHIINSLLTGAFALIYTADR